MLLRGFSLGVARARRVFATIALFAFVLAPRLARAEEGDDVTPRVLVASGAALAGLSVFFAFEAQLAGAHEAPPSESRSGIATVFTVVSISSLVLSLAAIGVGVVMAASEVEPARVGSVPGVASPVVFECPALSCLPAAKEGT